MAAPKCSCAPERTIEQEAERAFAVELEVAKLRTAHAAEVAAQQEARAAELRKLMALPSVAVAQVEDEPEPETFESDPDDLRAAGRDPFAPRAAH